jgi:hypothetical protein
MGVEVHQSNSRNLLPECATNRVCHRVIAAQSDWALLTVNNFARFGFDPFVGVRCFHILQIAGVFERASDSEIDSLFG